MSAFHGPAFDIAREQFTVIADFLSIPESDRPPAFMPRERSRFPAQFISTTADADTRQKIREFWRLAAGAAFRIAWRQ